MYVRLIAKHPDQPAGVHFDYKDVYKVARATFSGNYLLTGSWMTPGTDLEVSRAIARSMPSTEGLTTGRRSARPRVQWRIGRWWWWLEKRGKG